MKNQELTIGEKRCHIKFNPSNDGDINLIKTKCAELINLCVNFTERNNEELKSLDNTFTSEELEILHEANRCFSIAATEIETAQMYAVKGIAKTLK